ncbi:MAG: DUF1963 domain-containing protein [Lysobacter sp.]|nr:DUF1963 domain-containing protein [Lysobacter sp.]
MFPTREDAIRQLSEVFEDDAVAVFARLLRPNIGFAPAPSATRMGATWLGATRMGGAPDLPPGIAWPVREVPANLDEIAALGGSNHGEHIRKHLAQPLPYAFIAQIDLAEAARVMPTDNPLPDRGRLLFFCDLPAIPWRDGVESGRVIWDRAPAETLVESRTPSVLLTLAEESMAELRAALKAHGLEPDTLSHPYGGAERPLRLSIAYALPDAGAPEAQDDAAFVALMDDEDTADAYSDFVSEIAHDRAEGVARHRLLGYPVPEQDDPRYNAVALLDYGRSRAWDWPDRPDMSTIEAQMKTWHLLLQCDLSDYYQDPLSEGTVYFLIRDDDLRARNFERTVAVYQQT